MARNTLKLDTSGFVGMLRRLERLGGNVKKAVDEALGTAAEKIKEDTLKALDPQFLPAGGKYSKSPSKTKASVVTDTRVRWEGNTGWVPVGFDFAKPGAGGFLITGTPKMRPDPELHRMYRQKKYMQEIQEQMNDTIGNYVVNEMKKG